VRVYNFIPGVLIAFKTIYLFFLDFSWPQMSFFSHSLGKYTNNAKVEALTLKKTMV